jgi:hypothetical protein
MLEHVEHFSDTLMRAEVFYSWVMSSFVLKIYRKTLNVFCNSCHRFLICFPS